MEQLTLTDCPVDSSTPARLQAALRQGQGPIAVVGRPGSGRSSAVDKALDGSPVLRLSMGSGIGRSATTVRQTAATLRDPSLLQVYIKRGLAATIERIDAAIGAGLVLIDDADPILASTGEAGSWLDVVPGMLAPEDRLWFDWARSRTGSTVLVGQRVREQGPLWVEDRVIRHQIEGANKCPLRPRETGSRAAGWAALTGKLGDQLDLHYLAGIVARMLPADELDEIARVPADSVLSLLGRAFRAGGSRWCGALDIVHTLDGAAESVVRSALSLSMREELGGPPVDWLALLRRERLVSVSGPNNGRDGVVRPTSALVQCGGVQVLSERSCARLAQALLRTVNDPSALDPDQAAVVLSVHDLAVRAGLTEIALQTASLHTFGLIDLARRLSQEPDYRSAWQLYDRIEPLVRRHLPPDPARDRVRSYVLNYRAYNGVCAGEVDVPRALIDSEEATALWPENARWQRQRIELLLQLGRVSEARQAVEEAERQVAPHPQRARHLRVYPARAALRVGLLQESLALLDLSRPQWVEDASARDLVREIFKHCERGVSVSALASPTHRVVLHAEQRCTLTRIAGERSVWIASIEAARLSGRAAQPEAALHALVDAAATELLELMRHPAVWLTSAAADRKVALLSCIDVLQSDIGLEFARDRWFVGTIEGRTLKLMDARVGPSIPLAEGVLSGGDVRFDGLWFGRAAVDRAGFPTGEIVELQRAGSGRTLEEIRALLEQLWRDQDA